MIYTPRIVSKIGNGHNDTSDTLLDTLAQDDTNPCKLHDTNELRQKVSFQKRAKAKAYTNAVIFKLIDSNPSSRLTKSYWNSYHCSSVLLQEGNKVSTAYCNNRWCIVCNRIRTAKLINGYSPALSQFKQPMFVTLTDKTVKGRYLKREADDRVKEFALIIRTLKKRYKAPIKAIRKLEIEHSQTKNTFHPHLHIIVEGETTAKDILAEWLKRRPTANIDAQNIQRANTDSLIEVFKYATKLITSKGIDGKAQDLIFKALYKKPVVQAYGIKRQSENIEQHETVEVDFKQPKREIYVFEEYDWVSAVGECFSEYTPSKTTIELINNLTLSHAQDSRKEKELHDSCSYHSGRIQQTERKV